LFKVTLVILSQPAHHALLYELLVFSTPDHDPREALGLSRVAMTLHDRGDARAMAVVSAIRCHEKALPNVAHRHSRSISDSLFDQFLPGVD